MVPYRLLDLAAEDVDAEDLGVVMALSEGETVALWRAVVATHTEQDFVDGVVGDLCARLRIQQPDRNSTTKTQVRQSGNSCLIRLLDST